MKKLMMAFFAGILCLSLVACNNDSKVVRYEEHVAEDGTVITNGYNQNNIRITEKAQTPDGAVYEHIYDAEGNQVKETATLPDGSYHEFQYDKAGNVTKEIHK